MTIFWSPQFFWQIVIPWENHGNRIFLPFLLIKSQVHQSKVAGLVMKLSTLMKYPINFKRYNYLRSVVNLKIYFYILSLSVHSLSAALTSLKITKNSYQCYQGPPCCALKVTCAGRLISEILLSRTQLNLMWISTEICKVYLWIIRKKICSKTQHKHSWYWPTICLVSLFSKPYNKNNRLKISLLKKWMY